MACHAGYLHYVPLLTQSRFEVENSNTARKQLLALHVSIAKPYMPPCQRAAET